MSSSTSNVQREESSESDVQGLDDRLGRMQLGEEEPQPDEEHPVEVQQDVEQPQQIDGNLFVKECTKGCKTCPGFIGSETFSSSVTGLEFRCVFNFAAGEPRKISCKSMNVVYLMTCDGCQLQYVGETFWKLSERIRRHRSHTINKKRDRHIWEHLEVEVGKCRNPFSFTVQIIEKLLGDGRKADGKEDEGESIIRRKAQDKWILKLQTLYPYGFNNNCGEVKYKANVNYNCEYAKFKISTNNEEIAERLINIVKRENFEFNTSVIRLIRSIVFSVDSTPSRIWKMLPAEIREGEACKGERESLMIIEERYKEAVPEGSPELENPQRLQLHKVIKDLFDYKLRPFQLKRRSMSPQI